MLVGVMLNFACAGIFAGLWERIMLSKKNKYCNKNNIFFEKKNPH